LEALEARKETWQRICGVGFNGLMHDIEKEPKVSDVQLRGMWERVEEQHSLIGILSSSWKVKVT
jgi:hypothetical protein